MTDFTPQSTDKGMEDTNPRQSNILLEDSIALPITLSGSWYSGEVNVSFPLNSRVIGLDIEAWIRTQGVGGGNIVSFRKMPFAQATGAGVLHDAAYITILQAPKDAVYVVTFGYGTLQPSLVDPKVFYKVKSSRISKSPLAFT